MGKRVRLEKEKPWWVMKEEVEEISYVKIPKKIDQKRGSFSSSIISLSLSLVLPLRTGFVMGRASPSTIRMARISKHDLFSFIKRKLGGATVLIISQQKFVINWFVKFHGGGQQGKF